MKRAKFPGAKKGAQTAEHIKILQTTMMKCAESLSGKTQLCPNEAKSKEVKQFIDSIPALYTEADLPATTFTSKIAVIYMTFCFF